jgi:NAD-dependent deacetylase
VHTKPAEVWRFFSELRQQIARAQPNAAHRALAQAEQRLKPDATLTVLTQNVDGLHRAAGSRNVVELHGSLWRSRCANHACDFQRGEDLSIVDAECPRCAKCEALLRPDVVLFGEALSGEAEYLAKRSLRECDLFIAVGTSGTVSPASRFVRSATYVGARTVYVNVEPLPDEARLLFRDQVVGPAEEVLPALLSVASS